MWLFTIYSKFYRIRVCWWQMRKSKSCMTMKTQQKTLQFFLCHFRWQMVDWLNSSSWNHWMYIYCLLLFDRPRKKLMSGPIHVKLPEMSCIRFVQIHCPIWDILYRLTPCFIIHKYSKQCYLDQVKFWGLFSGFLEGFASNPNKPSRGDSSLRNFLRALAQLRFCQIV